MKIRISDVAEMAGVSRGTVDRVLHGRGHVDPDVERRILAIVQKLDYKPSRAAQQLSMRKRNIKLGFISRTDHQGFWSHLLRGVEAAAEELSEFGITVEQRFFHHFLPEEQLALIDELAACGISGLVIVPLDDARIRARLQELVQNGIAVILINSELSGFEPMCYVGSDYFISGQTAAGLMAHFANHQHLELAIFAGNDYLTSHRQRLTGFLGEMERKQADYRVVENIDITSDSDYAYRTVSQLLREKPETNAVFTISSNIVPVCKAIEDAGRIGEIIHIGYGMTRATRPYLLRGSLSATIGQEANRQGRLPFTILLNYLMNGALPEEKRILMRNEIFIQQNCIF